MEKLNIKNLIKNLKTRSSIIIEDISQDFINIYNFIQDQYRISHGDIKNNSLFKFAFRRYYFQRNEWFYKKEFYENYFSLFSDKGMQSAIKSGKNVTEIIERIIEKLYVFKRRIELSYITKMIHTINNEYPIYDSNVVNALGIKKPLETDFIQRKNHYIKIFGRICEIYDYIIRNELLNDLISKFSLHRDISKLKNIKILDFIFWSAGKKPLVFSE